jgi:hypothetical protein
MKDQILEKDEMKEIVDEFIVEAGELTEKAIQDVVVIENNPDQGRSHRKRHIELSRIRRAVDPCP